MLSVRWLCHQSMSSSSNAQVQRKLRQERGGRIPYFASCCISSTVQVYEPPHRGPTQQSCIVQRDVNVDARTVTLQHFQVVEDEQKFSRRMGIACAAGSAVQLAIALRGSASANKTWLGLGAANSIMSCALACGRVTSTARRSPAAARRSTTMRPALVEASAHGILAATLAWRSTC